MSLHPHTTKTALLVALMFALAGCVRQEGLPEETSPAAAASSSPFPTGNGATTLTLADCDKLPDPKSLDDSAAGRATAVSLGVAARAACKKELVSQQANPNADLARIREIKEKEQADQADRKISEKEWGSRIKEGGSKPVREFKY